MRQPVFSTTVAGYSDATFTRAGGLNLCRLLW